jgi:DNA-binding transcriptional LysR family regulator
MFNKTFTDVPIEVIRSFVAVAEAGSLSKAADKLGISQPAVSAQMKRLQSAVGGSLFARGANGTTLTELGRLALTQARRVLHALEQMLALTGSGSINAPLRLGISAVLLPKLLQTTFQPGQQNVFLFSDHSREIKKGLIEGYIDVGCVFTTSASDPEQLQDCMVERFSIPMAWARSKSFVLSPGKPVPIIALPEDDYMTRPLRTSGTAYQVVLHTPDIHARFEGVRAGLGLCALPAAEIPSDLVTASEYYLPKLSPIEACIYVRPEFEESKARDVVVYLQEVLNACAEPATNSGRKVVAAG